MCNFEDNASKLKNHDIADSRFVGINSRRCYETTAGTPLLTAHRG